MYVGNLEWKRIPLSRPRDYNYLLLKKNENPSKMDAYTPNSYIFTKLLLLDLLIIPDRIVCKTFFLDVKLNEC